jgi:hypothetical protein
MNDGIILPHEAANGADEIIIELSMRDRVFNLLIHFKNA